MDGRVGVTACAIWRTMRSTSAFGSAASFVRRSSSAIVCSICASATGGGAGSFLAIHDSSATKNALVDCSAKTSSARSPPCRLVCFMDSFGTLIPMAIGSRMTGWAHGAVWAGHPRIALMPPTAHTCFSLPQACWMPISFFLTVAQTWPSQ